MLRIHFSSQDLARVRVRPTVGAAEETVGALLLLRSHPGALPFRRWRTEVAGRLGPTHLPLTSLLTSRQPHLDLRALTGYASSIEEVADNLLHAPRSLLRAEIEHLPLRRDQVPWAQELIDGDARSLRLLAAAVVAAHAATVAPYWDGIRAHVEAVRAAYSRTLTESGVEGFLATLSVPLIRWRPPVLEVQQAAEKEVHLGGRGLVVAPGVFLWRQAVLCWDTQDLDAAPLLEIPTLNDVAAGSALWAPRPATEGSLGALLGRTRAAALRVAADGCTTTELARRLGVTPAAASQHATVLRNARLITTSRRGSGVLHTITALGVELLGRELAGRPSAL
ncbi:ArsR/SmtB family transcription factor [Streptomyces sp. NPDC006879]|uniref:ArsR/SmtB family transcription factor n=1 Tax=Streptomyces sp. NPDC006879 TaxID=3364767 RepID=UPI0036C40577